MQQQLKQKEEKKKEAANQALLNTLFKTVTSIPKEETKQKAGICP